MSFSLSWFTTISGILITIGVLLLVLALIILIIGKKKGSNAQPAAQANQGMPAIDPNTGMSMNQQPVDNMVQQPSLVGGVPPVIDVTNQPVTSQMTVEAPQPVTNPVGVSNQQVTAPVTQINTDAMAPTIDTPPEPVIAPPQEGPIDASVTHNQATPLNIVNPSATPVDASASAQVQPQVAPVSAEVPPVAPVAPAAPVETPSVQLQPTVSSLGQTQVMPAVNPNQSTGIYGGADPSVNVQMPQQPQQTQIYGGADPTQGVIQQ